MPGRAPVAVTESLAEPGIILDPAPNPSACNRQRHSTVFRFEVIGDAKQEVDRLAGPRCVILRPLSDIGEKPAVQSSRPRLRGNHAAGRQGQECGGEDAGQEVPTAHRSAPLASAARAVRLQAAFCRFLSQRTNPTKRATFMLVNMVINRIGLGSRSPGGARDANSDTP